MVPKSLEGPKLLPQNSHYDYLFSNPDSTLQEASYGIVDIQEYYDLNIVDLINGTIKDEDSGKAIRIRLAGMMCPLIIGV